MLRFLKILLLLCGLLWLLNNSQPVFADQSQAWLNNSATFSIDSRWSFKITNEIRCLDVSYADAYLHNWAGGILYKLPKNFTLAVFYKREHVDLEDLEFLSNENRCVLQAGWKIGVAKDLDFDARLRTEIREFEQQSVDDHLRFRFRFRIRYKTHIGNFRITPFISSETFGKTKVYTVQKNRFHVGTYLPIGKSVEFKISYLWLYTTGKQSIHILDSGVEFKF